MTMRDQCIEAIEVELWSSRGCPRSLAEAIFDTLLEKLKIPTEEMLEAGIRAMNDGHGFDSATYDVWLAMLSTLSQEGK